MAGALKSGFCLLSYDTIFEQCHLKEESFIRACGGKMGIAISRVLAFLEPCFYALSIVRMAPRRLNEKTLIE